jgi:hypothetical protein
MAFVGLFSLLITALVVGAGPIVAGIYLMLKLNGRAPG